MPPTTDEKKTRGDEKIEKHHSRLFNQFGAENPNATYEANRQAVSR
jgi:hypothetical protein